MPDHVGSPFISTPLLPSIPLSQALGRPVLLKLECLQPTGSFKDRGVGALCDVHALQGAKHFICASGGNAGLAAAYAGKRLGIPTTVVAIKAISQEARDKIAGFGAHLVVAGETWHEINPIAQDMARAPGHVYIHPFDHPVIWHGYAGLVWELQGQGPKPAAVILAVGGGGLLSGVCQGLKDVGWNDVPILGVETKGAASFHAACQAGKPVTLSRLESVATSLGASQVSKQAVHCYKSHPIVPMLVSDEQAMNACVLFARDHRILVEPACGAALAVAYENLQLPPGPEAIVVVVCGGSGISCEKILQYRRQAAH